MELVETKDLADEQLSAVLESMEACLEPMLSVVREIYHRHQDHVNAATAFATCSAIDSLQALCLLMRNECETFASPFSSN